MPEGPERAVRSWIETFQGQSRLDLRPLWHRATPAGAGDLALLDPWGARHRPDWHARGLLIWPRGGRWLELQLELVCPVAWQQRQQGDRLARLVLRWWADAVDLRVNGERVHQGDLFDTACRWPLPAAWWNGEPLQLQLRLRSPLHDDGALITSAVEQEPLDSADPSGVLAGPRLALAAQRLPAEAQPALLKQLDALDPADPTSAAVLEPWLRQQEQSQPPGPVQVLGHAHLDLAWLWPVADTWQAAVRTFESALSLMERFPELHFAHSTPALYAWIEQHRPALFARLRAAMQAGRFEPINGPWVESDCVLIGTASLLQQFALGQAYSRSPSGHTTSVGCLTALASVQDCRPWRAVPGWSGSAPTSSPGTAANRSPTACSAGAAAAAVNCWPWLRLRSAPTVTPWRLRPTAAPGKVPRAWIRPCGCQV